MRGPAASNHFPKTAADSPKKTMAMLKIVVIEVRGQSPGAGFEIPIIGTAAC